MRIGCHKEEWDGDGTYWCLRYRWEECELGFDLNYHIHNAQTLWLNFPNPFILSEKRALLMLPLTKCIYIAHPTYYLSRRISVLPGRRY